MKLLPGALAFVAGLLAVIQVAMNAQLRASFGHAVLAAAFNFGVGLAALLGLLLVLRIPWPGISQVAAAPTWALPAGVIGALFVAILAYASRDLGALLSIALVVTGQMVASLLIDHYGLLGFSVRPFSYSKLVGCLMMVLGLFLMRK
jgi:transporter family-2 protein